MHPLGPQQLGSFPAATRCGFCLRGSLVAPCITHGTCYPARCLSEGQGGCCFSWILYADLLDRYVLNSSVFFSLLLVLLSLLALFHEAVSLSVAHTRN